MRQCMYHRAHNHAQESLGETVHCYCTLRRERKEVGTRIRKHSLNAEGANGPLNQRDDFKAAKETCKRLHHEYTAITGCGNTPIPPQQQVRPRPNQQFEGHEEYSCRLDSPGWKYFVPANSALVFIFVITMATERQLVVSVELGLMRIIHHGREHGFF